MLRHDGAFENEPFESVEAEMLDSLIHEHRGPDGLFITGTTAPKKEN